ncbi:MAG: adenylate kinase family protein [Candidatus Bilamarchaeaceae archaeon]
MRILITGTPGAGKSEIAKELGKLTGWEVILISDAAEAAHAVKTSRNHEKIVSLPKLYAYLNPLLLKKDNVIFEGHLGCEMPCPADLVVVVRTNPRELEKRMRARGYYKEKIDENIMAELLDYCYQLAEKNYDCKVVELDTTGRSAQESARRIYDYINGEISALDDVDWEAYLEERTGKPSASQKKGRGE